MHKENNRTAVRYTRNSSTHDLPISVQIGKQGLGDNVLEEIKKHLKKRKLIKIKCLRYFLDAYTQKEAETTSLTNAQKMKVVAKTLETQLNCQVISITGFTIVLWHQTV